MPGFEYDRYATQGGERRHRTAFAQY